MSLARKKILITGATAGLGQHLYNRLLEKQHEVVQCSRQNGFDILDPDSRRRFVALCEDADVIINNAHAEFGQVFLLYDLFEAYRQSEKLIINMGSNSGDGEKDWPHPYAVQKTALDKACAQLQNCESRVRVSLLRFGWLDTERIRKITTDNRIPLDKAADIIEWLIAQPKELNVNTLTVVPW